MAGVELAVIINSFNRLTLLKGSLSSLLSSLNVSGINYSIIIYDANSNDGSPEWINGFIRENGMENIYLINPEPNQADSFSEGVNTASSYAIQKFRDLKYLFFYETDNFINSHDPVINAIQMLENKMDLAACGFTVKKHNGQGAGFGSAFPGLPSFITGQQISFLLKLNEPKLHWEKMSNIEFSYADVVFTSPLLIKKEAWLKVNGFDADTFPFSDCDIDLAYRISKLGYRMVVVKTDAIIHDNLDKSSLWSEKRTKNFYKARLAYFKKHFGFWINFLKPVLFIMHLSELSVLIVLFILRKSNIKSMKGRLGLLRTVFVNYR
jgi:GT2 family glycosyltransferase